MAHQNATSCADALRESHIVKPRKEEKLQELIVHQCRCPHCVQQEDHAIEQLHWQVNLLVSRLNEQHRRWFTGIASKAVGHGSDRLMSLITGVPVGTIRRGRREMDLLLEAHFAESEPSGESPDRIRLPSRDRKPAARA